MNYGIEIDFETRSPVDLLKTGVYIYAKHPQTDVLLMVYRIKDGPYQHWRRGQPCPADLAAAVAAGLMITAHNAAFERLLWWRVLSDRYGWPKPPIEQFRCTAVTGSALCLPRSLFGLGLALNLTVKKDKEGKKLIEALSIPKSIDADGVAVFNEDPVLMDRFAKYCEDDVRTEAEADRRMISLSQAEQDVYVLSERINDRGIKIDVESAQAALKIIDKAALKINEELSALTNGEIKTVGQAGAIIAWLDRHDVTMTTLDKETVAEFLFDKIDMPAKAKRVLELRQEGSKPSVEKIAAMLTRVDSDGRARGVYLHHGAGQTGRFSSRGLQAHNMPKPRKEFEEASKANKMNLDILMLMIRSGEPEVLEAAYGPVLGRPLHLISDSVRSFIVPAKGKDFINADFTSIEGVMSAWLSKEEWKLQAFRDLFAGHGQGIYELFAAAIYNVAVSAVTKAQRSVGKVGELALGYYGGVGALARMARANKLKLDTVFGTLWDMTSDELKDKVEERYEARLKQHDTTAERLGRQGWIAGELVKIGWRDKHPMTVAAWHDEETAMTSAVLNPGEKFSCLFGRVTYLVSRGFLWCMLPSGRCLAYGSPRIEELDAPWADKTLEPKAREKKKTVTVLGVGINEKFIRYPIFAGSLHNNITQGSARDILVNGMKTAEANGFEIVLHTHDECMAEVPELLPNDPQYLQNVRHFENLICQLPAWADDLPISAAGWRGKRYKKD